MKLTSDHNIATMLQLTVPMAGFTAKPMPAGRSLLLDLPVEIRGMIYQCVIKGSVILNSKTKTLTGQSMLACVSKQVHEEITDALYLTPTDIDVQIRNLDFTPIASFLNNLTKKQFEILQASKKKFRLVLNQRWQPQADVGKLMSWVNYATDPKRRAYKIKFDYIEVVYEVMRTAMGDDDYVRVERLEIYGPQASSDYQAVEVSPDICLWNDV